jgi:hypothetical protein
MLFPSSSSSYYYIVGLRVPTMQIRDFSSRNVSDAVA